MSGLLLCWELPLGTSFVGFIYLFFLPVMLSSGISKLPTDPLEKVCSGIWKLLSFLRLPSRDGSLSLTLLSLFLSFIFFLLSKTMSCLSGCLICSASVQKLFCGICSAFKCSFDEFVGEKVVSPSYSSTILAAAKKEKKKLLKVILKLFFKL